MSHPEKRPVTIEDLLRLKATERPPAEFWEKFDRELRAKQLAALVQKRPWWQRLPELFVGWRRYHLPLGATAVLAITFVSLRDFSSSSSSPAENNRAIMAEAGRTSVAAAVAADGASSAQTTERAVSTAPVMVANQAPAVADERTEAVAPGEVARLVNHLPAENSSLETLAPSARHIAANLAAATEAAEPVLGRGLLESRHTRTVASRSAVEPLTQVNPPGGARLAKFRSAMAMSSAQVSFVRGDERVVRELSDRLNEEGIRRFGAKGNEVSMKF